MSASRRQCQCTRRTAWLYCPCCGKNLAPQSQIRISLEVPGWDGYIHGELGKFAEDEGKIQCHICGRFYIQLGTHTARKHGVYREAYLEAFGLPRTLGMAPVSFKLALSDRACRQRDKSGLVLGQPFRKPFVKGVGLPRQTWRLGALLVAQGKAPPDVIHQARRRRAAKQHRPSD